MDEPYSKALVSKERAFLFLSIAIITVLLTGFPQSLKVFVLGTAGTITGGATAVQAPELKDYLIGLVIFAGLMVFLWYLVYALQNPKPEVWLPQVSEEEEFTASVDKDMSLDNNIEQINRELRNLRTAKEAVPAKKAKKVTKVPDVEEIHLENTLRSINAQLHGYAKTPVILEAPAGKGEWDDHLEQVKRELTNVDTMKFTKAKIREEAPSMRDIALQQESKRLQEELKEALAKANKTSKPITVLEEPPQKKKWNEHLEKINRELGEIDKMQVKKVTIREKIPIITRTTETLEQKRLARELQKLHQTLEEEKQNTPNYFIRRCIPSSREWQLANFKKHIRKKGKLQNKKELAEIEKRLAEIYQK